MYFKCTIVLLLKFFSIAYYYAHIIINNLSVIMEILLLKFIEILLLKLIEPYRDI